MWKLIITQHRVTESGYKLGNEVEFVSEDISKLTRIVEYFSNMTDLKTEYTIVREEEEEDDGK